MNSVNSDVLALNQVLVDKLKSKKCIRTPQIEAAFRVVPRHLFVPEVPLEEAYSDRAIAAKRDQKGQWISSSSQPAIMAIMLEQLGLEPGYKVLEIGAGTGYNAGLMAHVVGETGQVTTVDIDEDLVKTAREHLTAAGVDRVQVICADGGYGYPDAAPYDRIIVTALAWDIPPAWLAQMNPAGRLVLPLAINQRLQKSIAFEQTDDQLTSLSVHDCGFMRLRGAFAGPPANQMQLGPDPGLLIDADGEQLLHAETLYGWLTGASKDWETGVVVRLGEVLSGLTLWLMLREPNGRALIAQGEMVDRGIVPPLAGYSGSEWKVASTGVVTGDKGLVALMRPPGQSVPLIDLNDPSASDTPFPLFVRQFGTDESLAQRLLAQVRAWDEAGRPSPTGLRIRAYQKDSDYVLSESEFVIEKKWTRLILDWPTIP